MNFFKYILLAVGFLCLGILQAVATPKSAPNKHYAALVAVSWIGGTAGFETDWNTPTNWSTGSIPGSGDDVTINGSLTHYPVLNNNTSIQSLNVQAGASLTINASRTLTIANTGATQGLSSSGTIHNNGTIIVTITVTNVTNAVLLSGNAQFNNNAGATLTATTTGFYGIRVEGSAVLLNQAGGTINITGVSGSMFLSGSSTPEMVQNHGKMTLTGQIEKYAGTFHNYPCGVVNLTSGEVYNNGGQIINEGFFSAPANLNGTAADFINNGIIYIGGGSASYTNNKIRIFNNATVTGIFEFAGGNDLTVEGIYKDNTAMMTAGGYNQMTNTFTPVGVPGGTQTLYAKITRPGGTCPQIIPFSITLLGFLTQPAAQSICPGTNAVFSITSTGLTSYQWQESSDMAFTSPTNISTGGIYTVNSSTNASSLTIAYNAGVNGKYYRCVGSPGGYTSDAALLTVLAGSSATIAYTGSPYLNVGTATVTFTGTTGGTFSATPTGLSINPTTGEIDLAASELKSYTVTYTVASSGGCPDFVTTTPVVVRTVGKTYVWTGAVNTQWNNVGNWLVDGIVPSVLPKFGSLAGNPVQIPVVGSGLYPEVTTAEGARTVTIAANASLTVKSTGNLKVVASETDGVTNAGTFTNNGTVLIDSSYNDGFVNQTGASLINTNALTIQMGTGNRLENYGSINNSGTFTVKGGLSTAILNYPAATITNTLTFAVSGGLTGGMLNQGTVDNSGQLTFSGGVSETLFVNQETVKNRPGATMTVSNHKLLLFDNQKLLENEGNFRVRLGGDGAFVNREGATIRNKTGGLFKVSETEKRVFTNSGYIENYHTFSIQDSKDSCLYNTSTGEILNQGSWTVSGSNQILFYNLGKFTQGSTLLSLFGTNRAGLVNAGTFLSSTGCIIGGSALGASFIFNTPTGVFENNCTLSISANDSPFIKNQGRYTHLSGSINAPSVNLFFENENYAYINIPMIVGSMGRVFVNSDTLILGPQASITSTPSGGHSIPLTNTSTGYVHSEADFTIRNTTIINNAGKIIIGSQSSIIGVDMGTPIINTGNLTNEGSFHFTRFGGYGIDNSGTFSNKGRFETGNSGKSIYNNGGTIENSGVMEIDSVSQHGVLQEGSGSSFTNTATGQINVDFVFGNGIKNTAGSFINNGTILIAQTDTIALSGIDNSGTFQNNKLMRIGGVGKIKQHGFYNTGTFTNSTNSQVFVQSAEGSGVTNQGETITNQSCAYIESIPAIINAAGSFSNAGIIKKWKDAIVAVSNISSNSGKIINEDSDAFNVTGSNSGVVMSITSSDTPMCLGDMRTLTATPAGGTFSVTGPGTLAGNVLTATGSGTIVVSYDFNPDPNCSYYANQSIEVPNPTTTINEVILTQPTCSTPTGSATINAVGSGVLEYSKDGDQWQLSNIFTDLIAGNYTFRVRLVVGFGCISSSSIQTINNAVLTPTLTAGTLTNPTTCGGTNGSIAFTTNLPDNTYSVAYTATGATVSPQSVTVSGGAFVLSGLSAGTYSNFTIIHANCNITASASISLTPPAAPTITTSASAAICAGVTSFTIPYTSTTGTPTSYSISGTGITTVANSTLPASPIVVNLSSPATGSSITYLLTVSNASGCTSSNVAGNVTVNTSPTANISYAGTPFCKSLTARAVTLTGTTGGTFSSTMGLIINPMTGEINPSTSTEGTYTVNYNIAASGGCAAVNATTSVTIYSVLTVTIAGSTSVCQNAPFPQITFAATGGTSPYTFTYKINNGIPQTITTNENSVIVNQSTATTGVFTYTLVNTSEQCSQIQGSSAVVIVNALPELSFTGANPACQWYTSKLWANTPGTWTTNDPTKATIAQDGTISALLDGQATFTFTVAATGCQITSKPLVIKPTPVSALIASKNDVCPNTEVSLNARCSISTSTVNWNPGAPTVTPAAATLPYVYKARCTADGCTGNESSVEVRTHRILVDMKDLDVGALPLPIVRAVKDNMSPTNLIQAPVFPRRWTFIANGCDASESAEFKLSGPVLFNTIDNTSTYAMFANEGNSFYSLDHPNYGNGGSFPDGTYSLTVNLRSKDGVGGPYPKNYVPVGILLATRTLEFTVVGPLHGGQQSIVGGRQSVVGSQLWTMDGGPWTEISPNPVSNTMRLKISEVKGQNVGVSLIDASGRTMLQRSFVPDTNMHQEEFEVSQLTSGMYFLRVNTENKNATLKLVKVQ